MITQIGTVVVPVADQDAALAYYTGSLGFEIRLDAEFAPGMRWIEVAPPGAATSLAIVPPEMAPHGIEISFDTGDARSAHSGLRDRGVDADAELTDLGPEVPPMFTFRDPDGNHLRVVERPT